MLTTAIVIALSASTTWIAGAVIINAIEIGRPKNK